MSVSEVHRFRVVQRAACPVGLLGPWRARAGSKTDWLTGERVQRLSSCSDPLAIIAMWPSARRVLL
eukprot:2641552-Alexandrium_andersonii.AAC.1